MRSLGHYKIKQGILQQNLSRYYRFQEAEKLCEYFNKFVNTLREEREQKSPTDKYPWLDPDDERKSMTDRKILEKYINLNNSCLNKEEKTKVMDMLYKYRETFSLRDEIGTCPNIEVEIDVTDESPFCIRPYHVREEDKAFIDKEMKQLCYMGILKEGFSDCQSITSTAYLNSASPTPIFYSRISCMSRKKGAAHGVSHQPHCGTSIYGRF